MSHAKHIKTNPCLFQSRNTTKDFFEGWYFKQSNDSNVVAIIVGVSRNNEDKKSFIQIIKSTGQTHFKDFAFEAFKFYDNPFKVEIENNSFSLEGLILDFICDDGVHIEADLKYTSMTRFYDKRYKGDIMGPLAHLPFNECNHGVISVKHNIDGFFSANKDKESFSSGVGYIEKDWGRSFPKWYLWVQANNFSTNDASLMVAVANLPYLFFNVKGIAAYFYLNGELHLLTTYNGARSKIRKTSHDVRVNISKRGFELLLEFSIKDTFSGELKSPKYGQMSGKINEYPQVTISAKVYKHGKLIFDEQSTQASAEMINLFKG